MDETNNDEWVCPICETENTSGICVICGAKKNLTNEVVQSPQDKNANMSANVRKDSNEEAQWVADRWKRIVAIIILTIIVILYAIPIYLECTHQQNYQPVYQYDSNEMADSSDTLNIHSTPDIIDIECTGAWNDEYGFGLNIYGEMVYWVLEIEIDSAIDIFNLENYTVYCSWQDNPITCIDWKDEQYSNGGWEDVNCGATLWSARSRAEPLTYYVEIVLPDDETIAGEQFITINNNKVSFELEYLGSYSTGLGWDISNTIISNEE